MEADTSRKSRHIVFAYGYGIDLCFSRSYIFKELHHLFGYDPAACKEFADGDEATGVSLGCSVIPVSFVVWDCPI